MTLNLSRYYYSREMGGLRWADRKEGVEYFDRKAVPTVGVLPQDFTRGPF